jgi:ectoine hydroxylase-related dioxygenase (phytanoyl-CoA dioxygenase family)
MESAAVSTYIRDGFLVLRNVLDQESVAACVAHLLGLLARYRLNGPIVTVSLDDDGFLARMADDVRLSSIASCLLDAEPVPFGSTYFVKEPGTGRPVLWHQDAYPWQSQLGVVEAVTLWIALDPADEGNGGLQVIPRSHSLAAQPLQPNHRGGNVFGAEIDPRLVDATQAHVLVMGEGDVSAHHPRLIHSSPANWSGRCRRALAIRYRPK